MKQQITLKRAYDPASPDDGFRVYIDRLWPRGLSHLTFRYDMWDKEIAPSDELRKWFHADPAERWDGFRERYLAELRTGDALSSLRRAVEGRDRVTLLYSSHDRDHNNAVVVADALRSADGSEQ